MDSNPTICEEKLTTNNPNFYLDYLLSIFLGNL